MASIKTKPKKQTKADFLRGWGITNPVILKAGTKYLRYQHPPEKGVYWHYFSLHVRIRDVEKWGTCISCNRPITVDTSQAGHFMPAAQCGRDLLFDELNVNAECYKCNGFDETHLLGYAENLDKRYGDGTAALLRVRKAAYQAGGVLKDFKGEVYGDKIKKLPTYAQPRASGLE